MSGVLFIVSEAMGDEERAEILDRLCSVTNDKGEFHNDRLSFVLSPSRVSAFRRFQSKEQVEDEGGSFPFVMSPWPARR